ncbi:mRNA 3'-end-processing protein rna14 [Rhodosporidiobolus nylandii]
MSDAAPVDPRRARMQAAQRTSSPAPEPVQAVEQAAVNVEEPAAPAPEAPTPAEAAPAESLPFSLPGLTSQPASAPEPVEEAPAQLDATAETPAQPVTAEEQAQVEASKSAEMDAAIAATLAMETEAPEQVAAEVAQAGAVAELSARSETGTPALYGGASATDIPAAVATPPLASTGEQQNGAASGNPGVAAAAPKQKAASTLSRVAQLTARVERDPLDGEAQLALLQDALQKGDLERTREVYEKFLSVFPDAAQQWIGYCDLELAHNHFSRVEDIFARCLRPSTSVDLWRFYLDYIRRVNPVDPANFDQAKQARAVISAAFEFALGHVNFDRRAGEIWQEYIIFLREAPTRGTWEEQQKMDSLRKAFQRAVQSPINNVEAIWQEYNAFENTLSKMTAKKFIAELSPSYMTARKTLRELRAQHDNLSSPSLPHRPDWSSAEDRDGLERWKRYLAYEESNPLELEDPNALHQRVGFAYRKALANERFFPEIWYLSANFHLRVGKIEEGRGLLRAGMAANSASLLLAYTLADLEEGRQDLATCYQIYDSLITHLYERVTQLESAVEAEITEAVAEHEAEQAEVKPEGTDKEDSLEAREKKASELEELKKEIRERRQVEIDSTKRAAANVWITEMRFARRSDGVKQARSVFLKARKSPHLAWQVVEASATMEMYWNSDVKVATNVFELGLKLFSAEPDYVLRYLDFLLQQNNANNARALFERTVALIEPAKAKAIWDRMAQYEYTYGDYLAASKMAARYAQTFPETSATVRFAQQHKYSGLEDAFAQDLGSAFARQIKDDRRSRSPSPRPSRAKRNLSAEPGAAGEADGGDLKRVRHGPSPSPAPSSQPGFPAAAPPAAPAYGRPAPEAAPALNRAMPFMLDSAGHNVAVLPDAVVFFLSLLPPATSFDGPHLNPASIMDIIGTTILPGSAPGPGLPGERLGIPPRPKPQRPAGYGGGGGPPPGELSNT